MGYETELQFLQTTFQKCRVQTRVLRVDAAVDPLLDVGLKWMEESLKKGDTLRSWIGRWEESAMYVIRDALSSARVVMPLPRRYPEEALVIGPFLEKSLTPEQVLEWAERGGMSPWKARQLQQYYREMPVVPEGDHLMVLLESFGEWLWGESFSVVSIDRFRVDGSSVLPDGNEAEPEEILWKMQMAEKRYAYENEMMEMVERGQLHKAERLLGQFALMPFDQRSADPVRNLKNYGIIMNTLFRKAAQKGGVHPYHLDGVSTDFALRIEQAATVEAVLQLMGHIFRSYCRLVKNHTMKPYSPPVQKVLACVNADLTANLRLSALAEAQQISPAYLSALFRKETGETLSGYVNRKRMEAACRLLSTTNLQVQTVAQHCGILDVQYFSKLFKAATGMSPKEYRSDKKR